MWETFSTTYVEAAASAVPLRRLVVFSFVFFASIAVQSQTHLSIVETVANLNVVELFSVEKGLLPQARIANVLIAVIAVILGWTASRALLWISFKLVARSVNLDERVSKQSAGRQAFDHVSPADRRAAVELIDASLREPRSRLRAQNGITELCCGLSLASVVASAWGNVLDLIVGGGLIVLALVVSMYSINYFLGEYFGPALIKSHLEGRNTPSPIET
jgi:hypothetical protein